MDNRTRTRLRHSVTALIALLAGFLFVASSHTADGTNLRSGGVEDLRGLILERAGHVEVLSARLAGAQAAVNRAAAKKLDATTTAHLTALQQAAGLTAVSGPAVEVVLNDAPRTLGGALPAGVAPDDLVVHQQDVQSVVNAMWRGGALAVMVMDQRIVSTSAIRCVGNTLLLQGRVYSPPFTVTGVGDVTAIQNAIDTEPGVTIYRQYVEKLNLGWKESVLPGTTLPGWSGSYGE